ncbi:hypothetical protein HYX04_02415 [Candidatus Woesearchaeota archaeon]|nr:hypothetical protein [Candidatus Woesearchaeota archaeon]
MASLKSIGLQIRKIEERNKKVETDKAWETSLTRRFLLLLFTYLTIGFYLQAIKIPQPWLNAIVPAIAFMLSTLTLPFFKELWLKYINKK